MMKLRNQAGALESLDRAQAALCAERPDEALRHAMEARRLDPDHVPTVLFLAKVQLHLHDASRAMTSLDVAAQLDQDDHHSLTIRWLRARALSALDRSHEALALLEPLIEECPDDAGFRRLAGAVCERTGNLAKAVHHLRRAVAIEPTNIVTVRHLAQLLAIDDPQASLHVVEADHRANCGPAVQWQTAQWMKQASRHRDAEETYRQLLQDRPQDAELWWEAGAHAARLGEIDVAIARLSHALTLREVDRLAVRCDLARTFMHAGRFTEAAWHWWRATTQDHEHVAAWARLIVSALCCDRPHLVELAQQRLARLVDEDERVLLLAESWMDASGGEVIHRTTQPAPAPTVTASPLTWILQRSTEVLSAQVVRKPGWADTLYHTAVCEAALGDEESARMHIQAALDINPHYKAATTLAAQLPKAA